MELRSYIIFCLLSSLHVPDVLILSCSLAVITILGTFSTSPFRLSCTHCHLLKAVSSKYWSPKAWWFSGLKTRPKNKTKQARLRGILYFWLNKSQGQGAGDWLTEVLFHTRSSLITYLILYQHKTTITRGRKKKKCQGVLWSFFCIFKPQHLSSQIAHVSSFSKLCQQEGSLY